MTGERTAKPRIGIAPDLNDLAAPETEYVVRKNYADAIVRAGGVPLIIPFVDDVALVLEELDGLVITGGMFDIDPALYDQPARMQLVTKPIRTSFEMDLVRYCLLHDMPLLGICNGMQIMAVCLGGELIQHIPSEVDGALEHKPSQSASLTQHAVTIEPQSLLSEDRISGSVQVNSVHHQSVLPAEHYRAVAHAPDGVIEAIEVPGKRFSLGLQWHPEYGASNVDEHVWRRLVDASHDFRCNGRRRDHA